MTEPTQADLYDLIFEIAWNAALTKAGTRLMEKGLDYAASLVLNTPRPPRGEVMPNFHALESKEKQDGNQAGTTETAPAGSAAGADTLAGPPEG